MTEFDDPVHSGFLPDLDEVTFWNFGSVGFWSRIAVFLIAIVVSASEGRSDDYYVGGFVGVGAGRSSERGIFPDPGVLPLNGDFVPGAPTSTQAEGAGPSFSLVFGKNLAVSDGVAFGLEGEGEYQGARGRSSGSFYTASIPVFEFESSNSISSSTRWSVPAQAALRVRASFQVTPSVSIYGSLGPTLGYAHVRSTFTDIQTASGYAPPTFQYFDTTTLLSASGGKSVLDLGINLDVGLEVAIARDVGLRGEYSLAAFQSIVEKDPWGLATARATPTFQDVRLGLVKHF